MEFLTDFLSGLAPKGHGQDAHHLFELLLVIMVLVWVFGRIVQRMGLPRVLGEIFAGVILGPIVTGLDMDTDVIRILADMGVFFLMFHAGLDTNPRELYSRAKVSTCVCLGGILPIFSLSYILLVHSGYSVMTTLFMCSVLSLNSIPVIVSVLKKFKLMQHKVGHTALGASVANELLLFVVVSIILAMGQDGYFLLSDFIFIFTKVILFFVGTLILGQLILPYFSVFLNTVGSKGFTFALIIALVFGLFAQFIGLHIILGAYLGGMFVREEIRKKEMFHKIEDRFFGISYSFLGPIFFVYVGMTISFEILFEKPLLLLLLFLTVLSAQILGSGLTAKFFGNYSVQDSAFTGVGMIGRGGTEIIVAGIGFQQGLLPIELFSAVVEIAFLATFLMPFLLMLSKKIPQKEEEEEEIPQEQKLS
jgi:Kef-type K+ transport system membrane component KefB